MRDTTPADVETRVSVQVLLGFFAGVDGCVDVDLMSTYTLVTDGDSTTIDNY